MENYIPVLLEIQEDFIHQIVTDKVSPFNVTVSNSSLKNRADNYFDTMSSVFNEVAVSHPVEEPQSGYFPLNQPGTFTDFLYRLSLNQSYSSSLNSFKYDISGLYSILSSVSSEMSNAGSAESLGASLTPPSTFGLGSHELLPRYQSTLNLSKPDITNSSTPISSNPVSTKNDTDYDPSQDRNYMPASTRVSRHKRGISLKAIGAIVVIIFVVLLFVALFLVSRYYKRTSRNANRSLTNHTPTTPFRSYSIQTSLPTKESTAELIYV